MANDVQQALDAATAALATALEERGLTPEKSRELAQQHAEKRLMVRYDGAVSVMRRDGRGAYPGPWDVQLNLLAGEVMNVAPAEAYAAGMREKARDEALIEKHISVGYSF